MFACSRCATMHEQALINETSSSGCRGTRKLDFGAFDSAEISFRILLSSDAPLVKYSTRFPSARSDSASVEKNLADSVELAFAYSEFMTNASRLLTQMPMSQFFSGESSSENASAQTSAGSGTTLMLPLGIPKWVCRLFADSLS